MTIFTGGISSSVTAGRAVLDTTTLFKTKSLRRQKGKQIDQKIIILIDLGNCCVVAMTINCQFNLAFEAIIQDKLSNCILTH